MALRGSGIMVLPAADESAMTRKTILNDAHRALGAKMVDFGGWDMPLNYGSQIEEHHQVRRDAGMFDVSHMTVVDLHGARSEEHTSELQSLMRISYAVFCLKKK